MILRNVIAFIALLLLWQTSFASVGLIGWKPTQNSPKVILPKLDTETPEQAIARYLKQIQSNEDLQTLFKNSPLLHAKSDDGSIQNLSNVIAEPGAKLETTKLRVAIIANKAVDLVGRSRVNGVMKLFASAGGDSSVIAISADAGLSKRDADEFRSRISERFDVLVGLGGDDVDPSLYGQEKTHAIKVNPTRDSSELKLVKVFKNSERGVYFGVCRGHQMGAVADGHELYQDIQKDGVADGLIHKSGWHHINVEQSLFLRFIKFMKNPVVNSIHHQSVKVIPEADSVPVATLDGVVEALEGKNKMSFSVQFHPELGNENEAFSKLGFTLFRNLFAYARLKRAELMSPAAPRCSAIFSAN